MAISVTLNGAWQNRNSNGDMVVTVDATVGGVHHQAKFLKSDLTRYTDAAALQKYVAQQFKSVDAASGGVTTVPPGVLAIIGTVSV